MKIKNLLILLAATFVVAGCNSNNATGDNGSSKPSSGESSKPSEGGSGNKEDQKENNTPSKVTVNAHTLKDSNPPINVNSKGEKVSESVWESFRTGDSSIFNNNYNYTYTATTLGSRTIEKFTKNGYYMESSSGKLYYEKISSNNFYQYISTNEGWLRQKTSLDLKSKYTSRLVNEVYTHMFDQENYEYDFLDDGAYWYLSTAFGASVKFQNGYLTELHYSVGTATFEINASFETTIEIPKSYYYK